MTRETMRRVLGVGAGIAATAAVFALLGAVGLGIGWLTLRGATRVDRALAALLWVAPSAVVASAAGGWTAARVGGWRRAGAGVLAAAVALATMAWGVDAVVGASLDIESVRDVLDGEDIVARELEALPPTFATAVATGTPAVDVRETAQLRVRQTLGYGGAVVALDLIAGGLGGAAGARWRGAAAAGRGREGRGREPARP